jgi:hypothetical protein
VSEMRRAELDRVAGRVEGKEGIVKEQLKPMTAKDSADIEAIAAKWNLTWDMAILRWLREREGKAVKS